MQDDQTVSRRDFLQRLSLFGVAGLGASSVLVGCGGSDSSGGNSGSSSSSTTTASSSSASGDVAKSVTIHPKGNQMKFKETKITVPAGKKVEIVFDNTATSPSMQHNVVVLNKAPKQSNFQTVGQGGMQAGSSNDYVPKDAPTVLAHTPIAKPGETVSVTFTTPSEPGEYGYLCTYPGHWATMQGTMVVEA
jgi:azurin